MRPIDRFILHVVHNWTNKLNEAYSEKAIQGFINKFKEEADDLNISVTDNQLKAYINAFDRVKEKLPSDQRDLTKWTLSKLVRLVTSTSGVEEEPEEIDITPDVVYHNDNNTIVIYNGSKEDNCIRYGNGEKWCITRSSFANYRYNEGKGYPTFYLAKNNNLSDSDPLSFVAIQVRDPQKTRESKRYVYTNRKNSPYESDSMSFEELMNEIPWLREVPNIKSILKYIPLSTGEKLTQQYRYNATTYREWNKLPYSIKQQYLVIRSRSPLFSDIKNEEFIEKYLPKYPELAKFIAETPGVVDNTLLLKNLDKFPNQIRRSITANLQELIDTIYLASNVFPFDVKKLLVQLNKWNLDGDERLYITKDGETIVKLNLGDNIKINLYQDEDDFPNIKLNKRTSKYLLEYPELDKIPLRNLLQLAKDEIIDKNLITKVLDNAKKDPNSAIVIKPIEDGEVILDSNTLASYIIDKNNKITPVPFSDEDVQKVFADAKDNEAFQQNVLNLFKTNKDIPATIDKEALLSVIKSIPYNKRILQSSINISTVLLTSDSSIPFFEVNLNPTNPEDYIVFNIMYGGGGNNWRTRHGGGEINDQVMQSYFTYLRHINKSFNDEELLRILKVPYYIGHKKAFARNNPPVNENNRYKIAISGDVVYVVNTQTPRESFKISNTSGNLIKASISPSSLRQLLGTLAAPAVPGAPAVPAAQGAEAAPEEQPANQARRRGRPPGGGQPRAAAEPAAPAAPGELGLATVTNQYNLTTAFNNLSRSILRRLNVNGRQVPVLNNRGASRRQNILGNSGRVIAAYEFGTNDIYIIRLANNTIVASLVSQPGNNHYLITSEGAIPLDSPTNLLGALQQRNLAEIHRYIVNEYFGRNPHHLNEFKQLLRKHINEKKNETK